MKKYVLIFCLLTLAFPRSYSQPGARPSIALHFGPAFLFGEHANTPRKAFSIVNIGVSLSVVVYKNIGLTVGLRGGDYLSPDIPEGYASVGGVLKGPNGDEYNHFKTRYALFTYNWNPFQSRFLRVVPGLGIASNTVTEARFQPHVATGGFLFLKEPTHDVSFVETIQTGFAGQLSLLGVLPLTEKARWQLEAGTTFWSVAGTEKQRSGLDFHVGLRFSFAR